LHGIAFPLVSEWYQEHDFSNVRKLGKMDEPLASSSYTSFPVEISSPVEIVLERGQSSQVAESKSQASFVAQLPHQRDGLFGELCCPP